MPVKSDRWIARMAESEKLITPFEPTQVRDGVISYGLSSYGYDMRLSRDFRLPQVRERHLIDPKHADGTQYRDVIADHIDLEPGTFVLGVSVERFRIPRNILTICFGKSTYARSGVLVNITPFEPEWEGVVTMMIANSGPQPVRLYANEGIAQVIFLESDEPCAVSYADKRGKYQMQEQLTHSRL